MSLGCDRGLQPADEVEQFHFTLHLPGEAQTARLQRDSTENGVLCQK